MNTDTTLYKATLRALRERGECLDLPPVQLSASQVARLIECGERTVYRHKEDYQFVGRYTTYEKVAKAICRSGKRETVW